MNTIIPIKGNVNYQITLDCGVWIFDDRRIDLDTYFIEQLETVDEDEAYKEAMGKHWSREIMEGATFPPTLKSEKKFEKTKVLTGTFGMALHHFIKNAVPQKNAQTLTFETSQGKEWTFPLEQVDHFILKYSEQGKPLREDGPVHVLMKDGSNLENPIRYVYAIRID